MPRPESTIISITREDGYYLSTDASRLDVPRVHEWLSTDTYWGKGRSLDTVRKAIENSLPIGVFSPATSTTPSEQVAFARAVTDYSKLGPFSADE